MPTKQIKSSGQATAPQQTAFTRQIIRLVCLAHARGYEATIDIHNAALSLTLQLYKIGNPLTRREDHEWLGEWWEAQGGVWGGHADDGSRYEWPIEK